MYKLFTLYDNNWVDILPKSNNIGWNDDADTICMALNFDSIYDLKEGTQILLKNGDTEIFAGMIVSKVSRKFSNSYTAWDYGQYLNKNKTIIQFNSISTNEAIEQLCAQFNLDCDIIEIDSSVFNRTKMVSVKKEKGAPRAKKGTAKKAKIATLVTKIYKDKTIATIIDELLENAEKELGIKYIKEMQGQTLVITDVERLRIDPVFTIQNDAELKSSIEKMMNKVLVVSNEERESRILATAEDPESISKYGSFQEILSEENKDESKAKNIADNYLKENNKVFKDINLNLVAFDGADDIRANRQIFITLDIFGMNDWYKIKSASHTLTNNLHKVSITLEF